MRKDFTFDVTADAAGKISLTQNAPVKLRIRRLHVQTTTRCEARSHGVVASIDGATVIDARVGDCELYDSSPNLDVAFGSVVALCADGFSPGEPVVVKGFVEFDLRLFG